MGLQMSENDSIFISKQEVLDFARKIYQEAFCGYIDLQESTCASMVERLFEELFEKTKQNSLSSSFLTTSDIVSTSTVSDSSFLNTSINNWVVSSNPYTEYYGDYISITSSNALTYQAPQNRNQQLKLFEEEYYSSVDSDKENNSNEGHVFFNQTF
jgi:hypothetical protein